MLGLLQLPRIRKTDYDRHWEYRDEQFIVYGESYSFIVDRQSLPDLGFQLEAYPHPKGDYQYTLLVGSYEDCLAGLNRIAKALEREGIGYSFEMLDISERPDYLRDRH